MTNPNIIPVSINPNGSRQLQPSVTDSICWEPADTALWLETQPPALDFLFENIFPAGIVAGLGGGGGVGKSTFALELGVSLASGCTIFPAFVPVRPAPVMLFLGEDPQRVTWQRVWNVAQLFSFSVEQRDALINNIHIYPYKASSLCSGQDGSILPTPLYTWMLNKTREFRPALLVLDPKARWSSVDENSNDAATVLVGLLEDLIRPHNGSVLVTHHVSKSRQNSLDVSSARGASAFPDATRLFLSMARPKEGGDVTDQHRVLLHTTKSNYAPRLRVPLSLRHNDEFGGVFEQEPDQSEAMAAALAEALHGWLLENGPINESAYKTPRTDRARKLRAHLEERCEHCSCKNLDAALAKGIASGLLVEKEAQTGGRPAVQICAVDGDDVDDEEDADA